MLSTAEDQHRQQICARSKASENLKAGRKECCQEPGNHRTAARASRRFRSVKHVSELQDVMERFVAGSVKVDNPVSANFWSGIKTATILSQA
jgi:hypothetical protein